MTPDTKQVSLTAIFICEAFDEQPTAQLFGVCQNTQLLKVIILQICL